ncbi:MAG: V-type ATP synthase subunit C [Candidatus Subteraquimicrobiales bacterium]|nr:V-type ATP synthase subunit C [Candidatus Subteraquimicrobiales bacterium]
MFRTFSDPIKYGHATGRVKVLEAKLLNKPRVDRLVEADTFEEQLHILAETDYGEFFEGLKTAEDTEKALHRYLGRIYAFLNEVVSEKNLIDFFRLKYNIHNLKVLIKAKYLEASVEELYSELSTFDLEEAKKLIEKGLFDQLPQDYGEAVKEAVEVFEEEKDAQQIDLILDRELFRRWQKLAESQKNKFLTEFVQRLNDLANLKILLRAKNLKRKKDFIVRALFEGGSLSKDFLVSLFDEPLEVLVLSFKGTPYNALIDKVIEAEKIDLTHFDKLSEDLLLSHVKQAKGVPVGLEPVMGYILAKENEVNTVRTILMGKLSGLSKEKIKERVRMLYV